MNVHSEITFIALVVVVALLCGMAMARLKQPALVGYILAGVVLGPSGFGLVEDRERINLLAELGVLMLLFLIGMELSLHAFMKVWRIALLGTVMQVGGAIVVMLLLSVVFGWTIEIAMLLGFVIALSSTAVVIKMLADIGELDSEVGRVTVAILIAQDLAVVPMMPAGLPPDLSDLLGLSGGAGLPETGCGPPSLRSGRERSTVRIRCSEQRHWSRKGLTGSIIKPS